MDLRAVAEHKIADELEQLYCNAFLDKLKTRPYLEAGERQTFQWLAANFGELKAKKMVAAYFKLADRFIVEKAYPVKFMKQSVNQILALVGEEAPKGNVTGIRISTRFSCDYPTCNLEFIWLGDPDELCQPDHLRLCSNHTGYKAKQDSQRVIPLSAKNLLKQFKGDTSEDLDSQAEQDSSDIFDLF